LKKTTASQQQKQMSNCTDLISNIFATMEKYKEVNQINLLIKIFHLLFQAFFVIRLRNEITSSSTIKDTDTLIQCDLMDTRDAFLNFAFDNHYEFSSLRRAKFSTMALLYELHTSTIDKFTYYCNSCHQQCQLRYHCTVCNDFDLCEKCFDTEPIHEHLMERTISSIADISQDGKYNSLK